MEQPLRRPAQHRVTLEQLAGWLSIPPLDECREVADPYIEGVASTDWMVKLGFWLTSDGEMRQVCPACSGRGYIDIFTVDCEACAGEGAVNGRDEYDRLYPERFEHPAYLQSEYAAEVKLVTDWNESVLYAAERLFEFYGLTHTPIRIGSQKRGWQHGVELDKAALTTWRNRCRVLLETINGYGLVTYLNEAEMKAAVDAHDYRQAFFAHLSHISKHANVWGTTAPKEVFREVFIESEMVNCP